MGTEAVSMMYAGAAPRGGFAASLPVTGGGLCFSVPSASVNLLVCDYIRTIIFNPAPFLEYLQ